MSWTYYYNTVSGLPAAEANISASNLHEPRHRLNHSQSISAGRSPFTLKYSALIYNGACGSLGVHTQVTMAVMSTWFQDRSSCDPWSCIHFTKPDCPTESEVGVAPVLNKTIDLVSGHFTCYSNNTITPFWSIVERGITLSLTPCYS